VLLVEDLVGLRLRFSEALTLAGFVVLEAGDGRTAVEKATTLWPHAIVMGLALPVMDGPDAARLLKTHERTAHIPILGLALRRQSRGTLRTSDFDEVLSISCSPEELVEALRRLLAPSRVGKKQKGHGD
jgi:CheY-like chemotaxis protein